MSEIIKITEKLRNKNIVTNILRRIKSNEP